MGGALRRPAWFVTDVTPPSGASTDLFELAWRAQRATRFLSGPVYALTHADRASSVARQARHAIVNPCLRILKLCNLKKAALEPEITFALASRGVRRVPCPCVACRVRVSYLYVVCLALASFDVPVPRVLCPCAAFRSGALCAVAVHHMPCPCVGCRVISCALEATDRTVLTEASPL